MSGPAGSTPDVPIVLRGAGLELCAGAALLAYVERALGNGFSYPGLGWRTYAFREGSLHSLLSLFFKDSRLIAAESYVPRGGAPRLEPRGGRFAFEPGGIALGMAAEGVAGAFVSTRAAHAIVYDRCFEARFRGGIAYAMAREGSIERLALYAAPADPR